MYLRKLSLFLIFNVWVGLSFGQSFFHFPEINKPTNVHEVNRRLISLTDKLLSEKYPPAPVANANDIPIFSDSVYAARLHTLDQQSPIALDYKPVVKSNINAYVLKYRGKTAKILGRAELYFPLFEKYLDCYQLPLELKYLAVIESALDPKAKSRSGAIGLWQIMYNASRMFDLRITSYVDERMDPEKATEAACKYLQYLYRIFGDWQLAIASYNGGPGVVRDAIQRSGGKSTFWEIFPYLPAQTQNYVPAFIAANYVMNYHRQHNIIAESNRFTYFRVDSVRLDKPLFMSYVAEALSMPVEDLRALNPMYKMDVVPCAGEPVWLNLPVEKVSDFIDLEQKIYAWKPTPKSYSDYRKQLRSMKGKVCVTHRVKAGEFLHKIAMKYSCDVKDIKLWNGCSGDHLHVGQLLKIWVYSTNVSVNKTRRDQVMKERRYLVYEVQPGDRLESIVNNFNLSMEDLIKINGLKHNSSLYPGMMLRIGRTN